MSKRLERELKEANALIRELRGMLRQPEGAPMAWGLNPAEQRAFALLVRRGEEGASHLAMAEAIAWDPDKPILPNTVKMTVMRLRHKVALQGIAISLNYGEGYFIAGESLVKARRAISLDVA